MQSPLPDLTLLQCFMTVAETRALSSAAASLGLTQPAVTQRIKRLEAALATTLIDRTSRPLRLTQTGQLLADEAPLLLAQARALIDRLHTLNPGGRPLLRLGMPDSLSEIMGAEFIGSMQGLARQIELKSGISPWLETAFRSHHFDLAVDSPPFSDTRDIVLTPLFVDPFVLVLPEKLKDTPISVAIRNEPLVGYGRSSKFGAECTAIAERLGLPVTPRFSFDSTQSLLRFVQAGYGWAITSAFCLYQSPAALRDIAVRPCPESTPRAFHLMHRSGEIDAIAQTAATKFRDVFGQLTTGPWRQTAPSAAMMIIAANR